MINSSLKFTKNISSLNPATLGWVRPDKAVQFATPKAAQGYAKNRIMQALHSKEPFERAVFLKDNVVLGEFGGTYSNVHIETSLPDSGVRLWHGHPDNSPLSVYDFLAQIQADLFEIRAINDKGMFSSLTKMSAQPIQDDLTFGRKVAKIAFKENSKLYPKYIRDIAEKFLHAGNNSLNKFSDPELANAGFRLVTERPDLLAQFSKEITKLQQTDNIRNFFGKFWTKNAEKFGYKYSSDMPFG